MKIPLPLVSIFYFLCFSHHGMSQSPPTQPPPTPPPPAHDDSYREKYEQTVAEVEEANQTLARLLVTLEQKTNQSKELQEIIDLLENEGIPDARTGLEKSQNQLADLQQTSSGLTNEIKAESTKNEEWRLLENDLLAEIDSLTSSMNERKGLLADLELEIQNSIEALKVPHLPYWHYLDGIGWLWTAPQFHPYVYSFERDNWLFYNQGSHNPWQYFDYQSQTWEDWYLE